MNTPWGQSQQVRKIVRGVVWVSTAGHGGLGVTEKAAEQLLSPACRELANFSGGYFWFEEDVQCVLAFYEHPEWHTALFGEARGVLVGLREKFAEQIRNSSYARYFELKEQGVPVRPKLAAGLKLSLTRNIGEYADLKEGAVVDVISHTKSAFVFKVGSGQHYRLPVSYYYGHGYTSEKVFEPARV